MESDMNYLHEMMKILDKKKFPVYIIDNQFTAWPRKGNSNEKAIIISIPKSGTYFFAELLNMLGLEFTKLHISEHVFTDYRFATLNEARSMSEKFSVEMELENSIKFINTGQFAVGHLPCFDSVKMVLKNFKKIFVYRDLRDVFISHLRFVCSTEREVKDTQSFRDLPDGVEKMLAHMKVFRYFLIGEAEKLLGWLNEKDVFITSFEDLYGDNGKKIQIEVINELCKFLNISYEQIDHDKIMYQLIRTPTITWSGNRSKREIFWNDKVESFFEEIGGKKINEQLGYK